MLKGMHPEFIFCYITKDDATNMMNGSDLADKRGVL